jgi:serine/threonine-protein kinase
LRYQCPACQRSFEEPGFCPFDGKPLAAHGVVAVSAAQTVAEASEALRSSGNDIDPLIGQTLDGRYVITRKLGHGGMGVVYAANHSVIERPLAIKVLRRNAMRDPATIRRFVQEAKAASRIGHPNIVDVTDFGTTPDGMTYSVMEFVDGMTLKDAIHHAAPFSAERAVRIAAQIARALVAAHDKGIVHRDLKPENVFLVDRDGRPDFVKIVDFGIAKVQPVDGTAGGGPRLTQGGSVLGTPEYMPPEQASGRGDTDHRVDIYALGTILYEMLIGKVPHKGGSSVRTIAMQIMDAIPPPSQVRPELEIPPALEAVVMRALAKNRDERYPRMSELLGALDAIAASPPAIGTELTHAPEPRRKRPTTKPLHEPEFVAAPLTLHHAPEDAPPRPPQRSARWPYALAGLAVLAAAAAALVVITRREPRADHQASGPHDAAVRSPDAAQIAITADAGSSPADAAVVAEKPLRDAGVREAITAKQPVRPHPAAVTIEVLTQPGDAELYIDGHYRGPAGTRVEEPYGRRITIECRAPHMLGRKQVAFDGSVTSVYCTATRIPMCVEGLKNPYDVCEPAEPGPAMKPMPDR